MFYSVSKPVSPPPLWVQEGVAEWGGEGFTQEGRCSRRAQIRVHSAGRPDRQGKDRARARPRAGARRPKRPPGL